MTVCSSKLLVLALVYALLAFSVGAFAQNSQTPTVQKGQVEVSADPELQAGAKGILGILLERNQIPADKVANIAVIETDDLNAATDGNRIIFTKGLWNALTTNDQRAFVIAHELAHIELNHVPKTTARKAGILGLDKLLLGRLFDGTGKYDGLWRAASQAGLVLTDLKFSRSAEYQADDLGIRLMATAGYNTQGAIQTLEILDKAAGSRSPQFMLSHPLSKNRIKALAAKYQSTPPPTAQQPEPTSGYYAKPPAYTATPYGASNGFAGQRR